MNSTPDYFQEMGGEIVYKFEICRVILGQHNVLFTQICPEELRDRINESMHIAVKHYAANVDRSTLEITSRRIQEAAFGVVISNLAVYNMWRHTYEKHKNHPLVVSLDDLRAPASCGEIAWYCEREFGRHHRAYGAAMLGMTAKQYADFEEGRRRHAER